MGNKLSARVVAVIGVGRVLQILKSRDYTQWEKVFSLIKTAAAVLTYGFAVGAPQHRVIHTLFGVSRPAVQIHGTVASGYENVKSLFAKHLQDGMGHGAQCVAFVKGKKVVDLWGSQEHTYRGKSVKYGQETLQNVFSCSKVMTGLCMAMAADKGWLSLDDKVSSIWPEFAQHNKENITVSMVLRHDAGMYDIDTKFTTDDLLPRNIQSNSVGERLANEKSVETGKRYYHAITRGLILNEVFRRAHPEGLTIGQFAQQNICDPLNIDFFVGVPQDIADDARVHPTKQIAPIDHHPVLWTLLQSMIPSALGRQIPFNIAWVLPRLFNDLYRMIVLKKSFPFIPKRIDQVNLLDVFNDPHVRAAELPSANGHSNAISMATIASELACNTGRLLTPEGLDEAHSGQLLKYDHNGGTETKNTKAGWTVFDSSCIDDRNGFVGWIGYGGSCFQWHRELQIGFAYTMNCCCTDLDNIHFGFFHKELQMEVLRVAQQQQNTRS